MQQASAAADVQQLFSFFDKNGDGFISRSELADALRTMGRNPGEVFPF